MSDVTTVTVTPAEDDQRIDRWFKARYPRLGFGQLQKMLRTGQVRLDGKRVKPATRVAAGQVVRVPPLPELPAEGAKPARVRVSRTEAGQIRDMVMYQDEAVIVLNKPPGLATQGGTGTTRHVDAMLDALADPATGEVPRLVHRLDKDTSGVLVLGRTQKATRALAAAFRSREARKIYWALVVGNPEVAAGRISAPLAKLPGRGGERMEVDDEGKHAVTYYTVIEDLPKKAAWLHLEPRTGRTHQLRVHCQIIGCPIQGDGKYGGTEAFIPNLSNKLHLHARALELPHPDGWPLRVIAPLPAHMTETFGFLGFTEGQAGDPFAVAEEE